jgi:glyoxylase I family protein
MTTLNRRSLLTLGCLAGTAALADSVASDAAEKNRDLLRRRAVGSRGLHHVAIRVRDWDRTLRFYREVLGYGVKLAWEEGTGTLSERLAQGNARSQRWAYLDTGDGAYLEIFDDPSFVPPPAGESDPVKNPGGALVHFGVRTANIDEVCRRARAHGEAVLGEPTDYTLHTTTGQGAVTVRLCFLQGPNGEYIELLEDAP